MKTITQTMYVYAINYDDGDTLIKLSDMLGMESAGWHLIKEFEVSVDIDDIDYEKNAKDARLTAALAKQEAVAAEILELTQ